MDCIARSPLMAFDEDDELLFLTLTTPAMIMRLTVRAAHCPLPRLPERLLVLHCVPDASLATTAAPASPIIPVAWEKRQRADAGSRLLALPYHAD